MAEIQYFQTSLLGSFFFRELLMKRISIWKNSHRNPRFKEIPQ